jgi:hypothetical protein
VVSLLCALKSSSLLRDDADDYIIAACDRPRPLARDSWVLPSFTSAFESRRAESRFRATTPSLKSNRKTLTNKEGLAQMENSRVLIQFLLASCVTKLFQLVMFLHAYARRQEGCWPSVLTLFLGLSSSRTNSSLVGSACSHRLFPT